MKRTLIIQTSVILSFLILSPVGNAAQFFVDRDTLQVRNSSGSQLTNTSDYLAAYGWFVGGFVPTLANYSSWMSNFKGVAGYHKASGLLNIISAGPFLNFDTGPLHDGEEVIDYLPKLAPAGAGNVFVGTAAAGDLLPENQAFSLILWNAASIAGATEAAVVTNTSATWKVGSPTSQFDVANPDLVDVNGTVTSTLTGTFGTAVGGTGGYIQLGVVPEPSTGALMMIGAVGLVALRRLRKV